MNPRCSFFPERDAHDLPCGKEPHRDTRHPGAGTGVSLHVAVFPQALNIAPTGPAVGKNGSDRKNLDLPGVGVATQVTFYPMLLRLAVDLRRMAQQNDKGARRDVFKRFVQIMTSIMMGIIEAHDPDLFRFATTDCHRFIHQNIQSCRF